MNLRFRFWFQNWNKEILIFVEKWESTNLLVEKHSQIEFSEWKFVQVLEIILGDEIKFI